MSKMITITEIQRITEHCMKLLSCTEYLRRDSNTKEAYEFSESLFESLRKLFIATIMHNKKLICISGLQGAGKTTLMQNFYGIDEKYLNISRGRGERIPVLITEDNVSQPLMHAIKIVNENGQYFQKEIELSADDFIDATKGEDPQIMYLELIVPYKHTCNNGISFMLLPGFEKKNTYWNNLIEFSVNSSDAAVFVFNERSFSDSGNDTYLRRIESKFGNNLVYAITGSDGSPDGNIEVKETCIKVLNISKNENDRVVCTGQYSDKNKNAQWIECFKNALEKYAYSETQYYNNNSKYIYDEILEIKDKLYSILNILNADDGAEMKDHHDEAILRAFDQAVIKKRKEFENNLSAEFEAAKGKSGEILEKQFSNRPKLKGLKRVFFGSSVKEQYTETREMVKNALMVENQYMPDIYMGKALECTLKSWDTPEQRTDFNRLIDTKKDNNKTILVLDSSKTQNAVSDICALLADNSQNKENYQLQSTNPKKVVGAVAEIATYYYSLNSYNAVAESTGLQYYEPAQTNLIGDDVIEGAKSSKKFVAGMAGIMGFDLIGDGSINLVSQIAASFGMPALVAGVAAVAIVGAGAISVVLKDLNRMQREDFQSARFAVNSIYDSLKEESLKRFDLYMSRVRDRIEDNLTELSGDGKKIITVYNAKIEVNNTLNLLDDISSRFMEGKYGIESAFS